MKARNRERGFTLVEVMFALVILAIAIVFLLGQRLEVVREASRSRDLRLLSVLAGQKMAELELDKTRWMGVSDQNQGDFGDIDDDYRDMKWDYSIEKEYVPTNDPQEPAEKPKEIFRLTVKVSTPGLAEPLVMEGLFPLPEAKK